MLLAGDGEALAPEHGRNAVLADEVARTELGRKAAARAAEFSWPQSAEAMSTVLATVAAGGYVSGVL